MIFWGMGISQHVHGTDNARCLIALSLMCGQVGRAGTGLHPLRGQNNVQGASDAGLIPMFYPDYADVKSNAVHQKYEQLWKTPLSKKPGLTVVEIINAANAGEIRGMYIQGENPAMSDPDLDHARAGLAKLEHMVVQDIFLTETAMMADVVLPVLGMAGKIRHRHQHQPAGADGPQGARPARRHAPGSVDPGRARQASRAPGPIAILRSVRRDEARHALTRQHHLGAAGAGILGDLSLPRAGSSRRSGGIRRRLPDPDGARVLVPADVLPPAEVPDDEYPLVLMTGRQLEHWHTGAMTRRADVLDALEPGPTASLNPRELARNGIKPGEQVRVTTRRGSIELTARADRAVQEGTIFIPFAYVEAAANILTNPQLDPIGKIPEYKYCAVKIGRAHGDEPHVPMPDINVTASGL